MVATRNHPRDFPPPVESPTKRTTRSFESSSTTTTNSAQSTSPKQFSMSTSTALPPTRMRPTSSLEHTPIRRKTLGWCHTPPAITVPWLAVSLPLVIWDTIYILGRPHTFAGGAIAWPMYVPYELYGRVDPVYSIDAYYNKLGWTAAQGLGNLFETLAYFAYLYILVTYGRNEGKGDGLLGSLGAVGSKRRIDGFWGVIASLLGYTTFMVTVAKSVLYCKVFSHIHGNFEAINMLIRVQRLLHGQPNLLQQHLVQLHIRLCSTQVSPSHRSLRKWC